MAPLCSLHASRPRKGRTRDVTLAVIVCAYNEAPCLPACLYSLLAQTRSPDEIVVVDNASTDETGAVARHDFGATFGHDRYSILCSAA